MRTDRKLNPQVRRSPAWGSELTDVSANSLTVAALSQRARLRGAQFSSNSISGRERNRLFRSLGGRAFADLSGISGADLIEDSRAFARLDLDGDGLVDLAVTNANAPLLRLLRNRGRALPGGRPGGFLALRFVGANDTPKASPGSTPRDGVGARVEIEVAGRTLVRERRMGEGFAAQSSATLLVGLGGAERADRVRVRWPGGESREIEGVEAGRLLVCYEDPADSPDGSGFESRPYEALPLPEAPARPGPALLGVFAREARRSGARFPAFVSTATWCAACLRLKPRVAALRRAFNEEELALLGVPADPEEDRAALERYVERHRPAYRVLFDLPSPARRAFQRLVGATTGREALPSTVIADSGGRFLAAYVGVPSVSEVRHLLDRTDRVGRGTLGSR